MVDAAWVALSLAEHVGGKKLRALLDAFGNPRAVLEADPASLRKVSGIGPKISKTIHEIDLTSVEAAIPRWQAAGIRVIALDDSEYPARLGGIEDAPPTLFVRGMLPTAQRAVAIVGTRQPTPEASEVARRISAQLAEGGDVIVSGMARGIDREAHMAALSVPGGRTVAVLGSGVLNLYPPEHKSLAASIVLHGALVSEVSPDAPPSATSLVARNRLISGLSDAVIVVETSVDGGAMHAARRAREQGRMLYAVVNRATGNQALLDEGASPINPEATYFYI